MYSKKIIKQSVIAVLAMLIVTAQTKPVYAAAYDTMANSYEWGVLKIVNTERMKNGAQPISMFSDLQDVAHTRADEIAVSFSHDRPNGTSCFTAVTQKGIPYRIVGENIASGQRDPADVMNSWMNSPGHRSNILNTSFAHVGVGYGTTGYCGNSWTQMFVGGCSLVSATANNTSKVFATGTSINDMDRYLKVVCSDHGTSYAPIVANMCSGYDSSKNGTQTVKVKYQGTTISMNVTLSNGSTPAADNDSGSGSSGSGNNSGGNNSGSSSLKKPAKPTKLSGKVIDGKTYQLTWKKIKCSGYEVWKKDSVNNKFKKVKTISKNSTNKYTESTSNMLMGVQYTYKVRAFNKKGNTKKYGPYSATKTVRKTLRINWP